MCFVLGTCTSEADGDEGQGNWGMYSPTFIGSHGNCTAARASGHPRLYTTDIEPTLACGIHLNYAGAIRFVRFTREIVMPSLCSNSFEKHSPS